MRHDAKPLLLGQVSAAGEIRWRAKLFPRLGTESGARDLPRLPIKRAYSQ